VIASTTPVIGSFWTCWNRDVTMAVWGPKIPSSLNGIPSTVFQSRSIIRRCQASTSAPRM
jgi:hypothetical protein